MRVLEQALPYSQFFFCKYFYTELFRAVAQKEPKLLTKKTYTSTFIYKHKV